jgi:acyl dehydratase
MSGFVPQIAADAHQYNWRYLAPVAPPDLVRALVEALTEASSAMQAACERDNLMTDDDAETITKARAALQRAKETGV